jgi:hypothetical protein
MLAACRAPNLHRRIGIALCPPLTADGIISSLRKPRVTFS